VTSELHLNLLSLVPNHQLPKIPDALQKPWNTEDKSEGGAVSIRLAEICRDVYLPPDEAARLFAGRGFASSTAVQIGSTVAMVIRCQDVAIVAFRGTDDIEDWFINLDVRLTPTDHGRMHSGFAQAYNSVKDEIITAIRKSEFRYLWITGHSLGGALAVLCAHDFVEKQNISITGLVTFGQPMVADHVFADYLDDQLKGRYARFVNGADIVPRVPPLFTHCGSLFWLKDDRVKRNPIRDLLPRALRLQQRAYGGNAELAPLTPEQFRAEQDRLRSARMVQSPDRATMVHGNARFLRDHSIALYLAKIITLFDR
jgi:triacylglycerol lipase